MEIIFDTLILKNQYVDRPNIQKRDESNFGNKKCKFEKFRESNSFVNLLLGKLELKICWKLNEDESKRLLCSFNKKRYKLFKGKCKIPEIGYQGCSVIIPPNSIYVYNNIIIKKGRDILEIHSDSNRSFEKAILKTAPLDTIPDIVKEIEF